MTDKKKLKRVMRTEKKEKTPSPSPTSSVCNSSSATHSPPSPCCEKDIEKEATSKRLKLNTGKSRSPATDPTKTQDYMERLEAASQLLRNGYQKVADSKKHRSTKMIDTSEIPRGQRITEPSNVRGRFFRRKKRNAD